MWVQDATREDLLNIIHSNRLNNGNIRKLQSIGDMSESSGELQFLWKEDPKNKSMLPALIVLEEMTTRDFFAWTGTYLQNCRPLTAHCRVIPRGNLLATINLYSTFDWESLESICIGLILGEAATYISGQSDIQRLSMTAFAGTYSFSMSRAIAGNLLPIERVSISGLWAQARRLTGQKQLNLSMLELDQIWLLVQSLFKKSNNKKLNFEKNMEIIASACCQILQNGEVGDNNWKKLTYGLFERDITNELLKGPREERVLQVEYALNTLSQLHMPDRTPLAFIGGYLASRISPGTFDHHELLLPYLPKLPSLLLWYGLCAGMVNDSKLRNFGFGIGRRIIRDVIQEDSLLSRPRCDIALEELEVLYGGKNTIQNLHPRESGHIIVEIFPCVNSTMRNTEGRQNELDRPKLIQQTIFPYYVDELRVSNLLMDLEKTLKSADQIRNKIGETIIWGERKKGRDNNKGQNDRIK